MKYELLFISIFFIEYQKVVYRSIHLAPEISSTTSPAEDPLPPRSVIAAPAKQCRSSSGATDDDACRTTTGRAAPLPSRCRH